MGEFISLEQIDRAAEFIRNRKTIEPDCAIILGSGLGSVSESVQKAEIIQYDLIPHWPATTVKGHIGRLVIGYLENKPVLVMQGRSHYYEGYSMAEVSFPIRVLQRLGISKLIVTNAAGAINPNYQPGDLMLITDHINLIGMAGLNPLRGPNQDTLGPRFPDMSQAYDREYLGIAAKVARDNAILLHQGCYVCLAGPSFETPADLRFLKIIGADAVGMSTVPEVITARHGSLRVIGISGISNKANLDGSTITTHEEVLEAGRVVVPKLNSLIQGIVKKI
jgi:purine-nucleoside phosphorylase